LCSCAQGRESIAAKLTANLITEAGADRVLAMDLHSGQCVGYFDIPVDHVYGETVILDYLASKRIATGDLVVVSPDVGGVARARAFAKKLNDAPLAIIDKRRSAHNVSEVMHLIGDVKGKVAVLVDDMIDTAGTITNAGRALLQEGAKEVSRSGLKAAVFFVGVAVVSELAAACGRVFVCRPGMCADQACVQTRHECRPGMYADQACMQTRHWWGVGAAVRENRLPEHL
jgi:ribose-phosphate pyrophosphokinase